MLCSQLIIRPFYIVYLLINNLHGPVVVSGRSPVFTKKRNCMLGTSNTKNKPTQHQGRYSQHSNFFLVLLGILSGRQ